MTSRLKSSGHADFYLIQSHYTETGSTTTENVILVWIKPLNWINKEILCISKMKYLLFVININ